MRPLVRLGFGLVVLSALVALVVIAGPTQITAKSSAAGLSFGIAEVDATPTLAARPVYLAGFGQNRKATAVHDPIMVRAIVLGDGTKKLALVTVDVVGFFYPDVLLVRKDLPGFDYVLVSSTHQHEGPDTMGLWGPNPTQSGVDPEYLASLRAKIVKAVKSAAAAAQPAAARIGHIKAPELLHDSRQPYLLHDDLYCLRFVSQEHPNKNLGMLVQWNCHPETMDDKNTQLTADYPYFTVKALKEKHGCPVAYFTGTVGGLMTSLHVPIKSETGELLKDGTWEKTARYGLLLAERCNEAVAAEQPVTLTPLDFRARPIYVPMTNPLYHLGRKLGVLKREAHKNTGNPYTTEPITNKTAPNDMTIGTEIAALLLGEVRIACIPGEIYPELVLDQVQDPADAGADFPDAPREPAIFKHLGGKHQLLFGLANDEIGYILPKRQWDEKPPFCYGRKKSQYGEQNSVGPAAGPVLCETFAELMKD